LAWLSLWDIGVFFNVLVVGFAYVWKRGALDLVRAVANQRPAETLPPPPASAQREPAMMA
jgi:NADH-quinone oxidoreductase subunit A